MNQSFERSCRGKVRHRTWRHAQLALKGTGLETGTLALVAYHCVHCDGYHVGHPKKSEQRRLRFDRIIRLIDRANGRDVKQELR